MSDETKTPDPAADTTKTPRTKETVKSVNLRMKDDVREMLLDLNEHQQELAYGATIPLNMTLEFAVRRAHEAVFRMPAKTTTVPQHRAGRQDKAERLAVDGKPVEAPSPEPEGGRDEERDLAEIEAMARSASGSKFQSSDL